MDVGYARVSTREQDLDLQRDALETVGVGKIYWEKVSSRKDERPELAKALDYCREGDILVVYKLDRLGRSLKELLQSLGSLEKRGVGFRSLQEALDTTTPGGRLVFHIFASLAEFERDLIRERTMAGLQAARARGRKGGRKPKMDDRKIALARKLMADPDYTIPEICKTLGVSNSYAIQARVTVGNRRFQTDLNSDEPKGIMKLQKKRT